LRPFDSNGTFCRPEAAIRQLAIRGAGVTVFSGSMGIGLQLISTIVLARLLTAADFGVVTMVTTFSLLLVNFGLNGFTEAVIQREDIGHTLATNLFWITVSAGFVLTCAFAAAGSVLARFYHDPLVKHVAAGVSLTIFLTSAQVMHLALLKRAMRFSQVSVNDVISRAVSIATAILLAWRGFGYWSLVAGAIAQPFSACIGAWTMCRWLPGLPQRVPGTGAMVRFAFHVYARFTFNYFSRNTDNVLVGWRFDAQALGFYKKAYDLFALSSGLLVSSLTSVAIAALSRCKNDPHQFQKYLFRALSAIAFVGMGLAGELTLTGKYVIKVLLGPGWEPSGQMFTFFGPGIGVMLLYGTTDWIHLSIGRPDRWFRWSIIEYVLTALLFLVGLHWGPVGVAMAWTASFWLLTVPAFWYAGRPMKLKVTLLINAVWKYVAAALLAVLSAAMALSRIPAPVAASTTSTVVAQLALASVLFASFYLACLALLYRGMAPLREHSRLLGEMIPWNRLSRFARQAPASVPATRT